VVIAAPRSPTPQLDALLAQEPDFVDRIFEYLLCEFPQIAGPRLDEAKRGVREQFGAREVYVRSAASAEREALAKAVLALFNGRNATEVARRLQISRATVYRMIKQPGPKKKSQGSR
jgi:Mor family transcriptional regulator